MSDLPPVVTPFSHRWREFRIQYLPFVIFVITLLLVGHFWREWVIPVEVATMPVTNEVQAGSTQIKSNPDKSIAESGHTLERSPTSPGNSPAASN